RLAVRHLHPLERIAQSPGQGPRLSGRSFRYPRLPRRAGAVLLLLSPRSAMTLVRADRALARAKRTGEAHRGWPGPGRGSAGRPARGPLGRSLVDGREGAHTVAALALGPVERS